MKKIISIAAITGAFILPGAVANASNGGINTVGASESDARARLSDAGVPYTVLVRVGARGPGKDCVVYRQSDNPDTKVVVDIVDGKAIYEIIDNGVSLYIQCR